MWSFVKIIKKILNGESVLYVIAISTLLYSTYLAIAYANQVPLDIHSFRQSQTAVTAYWFKQEGFNLAYQTPVAGIPWSIPFEFPIYQATVALFSKVFDLPLDLTGRLTSHLFLLLTLIPVYSINKKLQLPNKVFITFVALLFSMPIYLYWGRSFMIEMAAVFFSITSIKFFLDFLDDEKYKLSASLFILFATLGVLQKATTALPILLVLSAIYMTHKFKTVGTLSEVFKDKHIYAVGFFFLVPVLIGYLWVDYSDQVKSLNALGMHLTSENLTQWNWGTLSQRVSTEIWTKVIWERMFVDNLGAVIGVFILLVPFFCELKTKVMRTFIIAILLGLLPLFLFINLHLVHNYYQSANLLFFAYALALSIGAVMPNKLGEGLTLVVLLLVLTSNYFMFNQMYLPSMQYHFDEHYRDYAIGSILKREVPKNKQFVAFGNDWSSTFGYIAERKSFTAPDWIGAASEIYESPASYVDKNQLAAVVDCGKKPKLEHWLEWSLLDKTWKVGQYNECLIATPEKRTSDITGDAQVCEVLLEKPSLDFNGALGTVQFSGWLKLEKKALGESDEVYLILQKEGEAPLIIQTLKVPKPEFGQSSDKIKIGFSRILVNDLKPGEYEISLLEKTKQTKRLCELPNKLVVPK